jgi:flagellar assembly protein FliH
MSSSAPQRQAVSEGLPFAYVDAGLPGSSAESASDPCQSAEERSRRQQAEVFEQGRQAGQQQLRSELDAVLAKSRREISHALEEFSRERQSYYRRIEGEVVELALAVARKILHREAQIDPMLLAGMVRITLEKIESATKVMVRVHPQQVSECRSYFAQHMEASQVPDVVEDAALQKDHCILQTALGTTEVGVDLQLKEIEQGLFDLLAKRPASV